MIIADTNVISEVMKPAPDKQVLQWWHRTTEETVAITAMTLSELHAGIMLLPDGHRRDSLAKALDTTIQNQMVIPFDAQAAFQFGVVVSLRRQLGKPISTVDAQIAATCRAYSATCATRNIKDFSGTGVTLLNPWEE